MKKGFIGGFAGAFIAVILVVVILISIVYVFAPNFLPKSPCLPLGDMCQPQKLCCTWRCDSTEIDWWKCPDNVCELLGENQEPPSCECKNLKCTSVESETISQAT